MMGGQELTETENERRRKKRGGRKMRDNHDTGNIVRNRERSEGKEINETCETEYRQTRGGPHVLQSDITEGRFK